VYDGAAPQAHLGVNGAHGTVGWLGNGALVGRAAAGSGCTVQFAQPGEYAITAFDEGGHYDRMTVEAR
jgi:penicillin-binding protein 1C